MIKDWFSDLYARVDEFFSRDENKVIESLKSKLKDYDVELTASNKLLTSYANQIVELKFDLSEFRPNVLEVELNSRLPKVVRKYLRKELDGDYSIDVRNYWMLNDSEIPVVSGKNNDEKAVNALKKVMELVKYTKDKVSYGFSEYWAYPYQTLKRGVGDCEDGAILLANILVRSGVPYYRVRLNAGSVRGGGHAYVTYCRESDDEFVVLDWCYWPNSLPVSKRKTHKEERNYMNKENNFYVWFSWNREFIFGKEESTEGFES